MADPIHILLVDDDEDDYILTRDLLSEIPDSDFRLQWEPDYGRAIELICQDRHDLILVDYRLGKHNGLELMGEVERRGCRCAMILLTGQGERQIDFAAMEIGAADYLEKNGLNSRLLERSIRYTLQNKRHANQLEQMVQERTRELAASNESLRAEIAERGRIEEALREADRRKDEFLATLAHELRNPLVPIRNSLELMRLSDHDPKIVTTGLDTIARHVQTLIRLIEDLLDVSRISRGTIQLRPERVNIATVVEHALECTRPLIERHEHQIRVELPPEPVYVQADPTRLSQVITNLLNNATRYTDPGGQITLAVDQTNSSIVVRVRDNGMGIPAEALSSIFKIFSQVDRGEEIPASGVGIGLWLVDNLVQMHGGRVEAYSEGPGKGSEFQVHLPLHPTTLDHLLARP